MTTQSQANVHNFVIAQNFFGGRLVPLTGWYFTSRDCNIEGVINQVILKDSIPGGAEGERQECINPHESGLQRIV